MLTLFNCILISFIVFDFKHLTREPPPPRVCSLLNRRIPFFCSDSCWEIQGNCQNSYKMFVDKIRIVRVSLRTGGVRRWTVCSCETVVSRIPFCCTVYKMKCLLTGFVFGHNKHELHKHEVNLNNCVQ